IGARTWVRMPDVGAPLNYSNQYVCTSAGTTAQASGAGYTLTCGGGT
ncbi:MAG: hypothetical protein JWM71_2127, partial [Solirubrobacteraceae bacterium]|nr:hypothetical protein [Solirubrobacteraceae bacterium]